MNSELDDIENMLTTITITLMRPYLNNGHTLFVDNFYTTPRLAQYMLEHDTKLVGTIRSIKLSGLLYSFIRHRSSGHHYT